MTVPASPGRRRGISAGAVFRPPFHGLWLVVVLYYAFCFVVCRDSQALKSNLPDPDDYMYLTQLLDWLRGGSWYDNVQHRLNPPYGAEIPFSRLAQLPMAVLLWVCEIGGQQPADAAISMALIYPVLLFAALLLTLRWVARCFLPVAWTGVTAYSALFATMLIYMFQPGHVDHHGLNLILVALAFGCALRMLEAPAHPRWGVACGVTLAVGMTIALEILPWLLLIAAWLGLWGAIKGGAACRHGRSFGLALALGSAACLLTARSPADLMTPELLSYSVAYVAMAGGIAICFVGSAAVADRSVPTRLLVALGMAFVTAGLFFYRFPALLSGPFGAMDPLLSHLVLGEVGEALPLARGFPSASSIQDLYTHLSYPLAAFACGVYFMIKAPAERRPLWGLLLTLLLAAIALATFYQARFEGVMGMLAVLPFSVLLQRGWLRTGARWSRRWREPGKAFTECGLLLVAGPLFSVLLPDLLDGTLDATALLFPAASNVANACDLHVLAGILNDPKRFGDRPRLIANDMDLGPELLFRTPHEALAAPFLDTAGNLDAYHMFSTTDPREAEAIIRRRHIDLIISCLTFPPEYLHPIPELSETADSKDFRPHFVELLQQGLLPGWIREVPLTGVDNFVVYEILPTAGSDISGG
ncbi:MAG: hypothetical protein M3N08_02420 [Pseudomonadota bacterium]|nr:hypothetical protein [Pseudomonadota bacterium]